MTTPTYSQDDRYARFVARYEAGDVPWDDTLPPPEVIALSAELAPARALDLGCGYGRTSLFLAQKGWQTVGIDFVPDAIAEAQRRAISAELTDATQFMAASVTALDFLSPSFQLAVDVGCMHALNQEELALYHAELQRLLPFGATFLLFARLRDSAEIPPETGPRGIPDEWIRAQFSEATGFALKWVEYGHTDMPDQSWSSAWYRFERV